MYRVINGNEGFWDLVRLELIYVTCSWAMHSLDYISIHFFKNEI